MLPFSTESVSPPPMSPSLVTARWRLMLAAPGMRGASPEVATGSQWLVVAVTPLLSVPVPPGTIPVLLPGLVIRPAVLVGLLAIEIPFGGMGTAPL